MHLVQVPIVLGRGVRIWDGLEALEDAYDVEAVSSPAASPTSRSRGRSSRERRHRTAGVRTAETDARACFAPTLGAEHGVAVIRYRDRRQNEQRAGPNPLRHALFTPIEGSVARHEFPGHSTDAG
jgi:hypothetical protein